MTAAEHRTEHPHESQPDAVAEAQADAGEHGTAAPDRREPAGDPPSARDARAGATPNRGWLRVYLQDHHAAAAAGVALSRRALGEDHAVARP